MVPLYYTWFHDSIQHRRYGPHLPTSQIQLYRQCQRYSHSSALRNPLCIRQTPQILIIPQSSQSKYHQNIKNPTRDVWLSVLNQVFCNQRVYNLYLMQSQIEDTFKDQIIKQGTIAIDTLIDLMIPFLPPFLDKDDVRSIALLLLSILTPAAFIGGTAKLAEVLSEIAIFGFKSGITVAKVGGKIVYYSGKIVIKTITATASIATAVITAPFYVIAMPFRSKDKKGYKNLLEAISKRQQKLISQEQMGRFQNIMANSSSDKIFIVIRRIQTVSNTITLRMVGSMPPSDSLVKILSYLKQKDTDLSTESIQFICNRVIVNLNSTVSSLPKNQHGFVDLYYAKMETFG